MQDEETKHSWAVEVKEMVQSLKAEAEKDMNLLNKKDDDRRSRGTSATRVPSRKGDRTSRSSKGKKREPTEEESDSPPVSPSMDDDHSDDDPPRGMPPKDR